MNDQAKRLRELASARVSFTATTISTRPSRSCQTIGIVSGKGGVGKTNIALFLAIAIRSSGKKVLLLDADLGLANIHILLGCAPKKNLSHILEGASLQDVIISGPEGIDILPGASGLESIANLDIGRLEFLRTVFNQVEKLYDIIIFDLGAGISTGVTRIASYTDLALLILTPEPTSLADAYAMVKILYEKGTKKIAVTVNMANSDKEGNEIFDRLNTIVVQFLKRPLELFGIILLDRDLSAYIKKQKIMIIENSRCNLNLRIRALARCILSGTVENRPESFFSRLWTGLRHDS